MLYLPLAFPIANKSSLILFQVFELLWCLVCHDIWYVWGKSFFLQQANGKQLVSEPFSVRGHLKYYKMFCAIF